MKVLLILIFVAYAQTAQHWPNFHTTYGIPFVTGMHTQPTTQVLADALGYTQYGNCDDGSAWVGVRYGHGIDRDDIGIIFDINGFVAGMQSIVPKIDADRSSFDFESSPMYINSDWYGEEVYIATVYFIEPSLICTVGRTREEFDIEGTGNSLIFQNGPNANEEYLLRMPLTEQEAIDDPMWNSHNCYTDMGNNFFTTSYDPAEDCANIFPAKLLFHRGELNAFAWQHQAGVVGGNNWEHPDPGMLIDIYDSPPSCILDQAENEQFTTMHVYLSDYLIACE